MKINKYDFGKTHIWYLIDDKGKVSMLLIPENKVKDVAYAWDKPNGEFDARGRYTHQWGMGNLVHLQLSHHSRDINTMKFSESTKALKFASQDVEKSDNITKVITILRADEGYSVKHTLIKREKYNAFEVFCEFTNESENTYTLEFITAFSMDNLSPFIEDDGPDAYSLHRFYGGWSLEGKHKEDTLESLSLEKSYYHVITKSEKFGSLGSYPVGRYFPMAVVEDKKNNVFWAAQIAHNATWQMEYTRYSDNLSLSGSNGDCEFGAWYKNIAPDESYKTPSAYIGAVDTDLFEACQSVVSIGKEARQNCGEKGLPVCFNEFCTSWGEPTQDKMIAYANALKDRNIKYVVIDAGWSKGCYGGQRGNGDWIINEDIFPDMKKMSDQIRSMGMIPGIWFEFEATTEGADVFKSEYDNLHLKRNGVVINNGKWRTFWDFRKPEVVEYISNKVIGLLKECGFGYIKVDYNSNIGLGCDGCESLGEGLRQHTQAVYNFFKKMKEEIPDLIIENCASGGHRLEPKMLGASALASFSDAHEAIEIPYVAANLNNLILPEQSLIWAVIHHDDDEQRIIYSMAATFLGRICLSGDVDKLSDTQWKIISDAIDFYNSCESIILEGISKIYGNRGNNTRYPIGTQVVVRYGKDEIMAVAHAYENASDSIGIDIPDGYKIEKGFGNFDKFSIFDDKLILNKMNDLSACAVKLVKISK